ncbi:MAG: hypothetical protein ACLUKN_00935 [Bacilli bacterium]
MEGRRIGWLRFPEPRRCGQVVLEVSGVNKLSVGIRCWAAFRFGLNAEKVALVGVNSVGKYSG